MRRDIEGLRAVAVVLVVLAHMGLPVPSGFLGVDVFFVISGYLITGQLLRELDDTGRISWPRFLARRARRLLPAAVLVLLVTALLTVLLVPAVRRPSIGWDVVAAGTYVVNWLLAARSVDYLEGDAVPSPVQHYWSLSVEEQFYVLWPLALIGLAWLLRRRGRRPGRPAVALLLAGLAVPSFAYAVLASADRPDPAYFVTTTRVWELGVGAALAVAAGSRWDGSGLPGRIARLLAWAGLAAVAVAAVVPLGSRDWPSWATLAPTLATAAVIWAGPAAGARGPVALLGRAPMVWVGGLSYSLYLWHWPAISLLRWARETPPGLLLTTAAVAVSVVLAWAAHRIVEEPLHRGPLLVGRTRRSLLVGLALSLATVLAGVPVARTATQVAAPAPAGVDAAAFGAAGLGDVPGERPEAYAVDRWDWVAPDPTRAGEDRPAADVDRCQVDVAARDPVRCDFGVPGGRTDVALVGDSKAMQWLPALERLARDRSLAIHTYGKSSCSFAGGRAQLGGRPYPECDAWGTAVLGLLRADPPDVLVTSGAAVRAWGAGRADRAALVDGLARRWAEVAALGTRVVVVLDNPVSPDDLDVCASRHSDELTRCAFDRTAAVAASAAPVQREAAARGGVTVLDLTDWICPTARCPLVIDHVTVHRAGDHVTATYAASLASRFAEALPR